MIAEHGTASHVENLVRAYRRCQEAEELSREQRQQENRSVMYRWDDDGSLVLTCRLPAETGTRVMKAIDIALEQLPSDLAAGVPAGTSREPVRFSARDRHPGATGQPDHKRSRWNVIGVTTIRACN